MATIIQSQEGVGEGQSVSHDIVDVTKQTNTCRKAVKNTTIIVIYKVLAYIQISANYMFRPLLVRPSSGWIPSPRKYTIVLYNH